MSVELERYIEPTSSAILRSHGIFLGKEINRGPSVNGAREFNLQQVEGRYCIFETRKTRSTMCNKQQCDFVMFVAFYDWG